MIDSWNIYSYEAQYNDNGQFTGLSVKVIPKRGVAWIENKITIYGTTSENQHEQETTTARRYRK